MEDLIPILGALVTGIIGWFGNAYRNKQKKEKDVLDNVQLIIDIQNQRIAKDEQERQEFRAELADSKRDRLEMEHRLDLKRWSIRKALNCKYVNSDGGCPVIQQEEKNEQSIAQFKCETCKFQNDEEN